MKIPIFSVGVAAVGALRQEGGYAKWAEAKAKLPGQT